MIGDEDFLELLHDKLREADVPQPVIDLVAAHPARVFTGYDPRDPGDIVILNNKVLYLRDLATSAGIGDGDPVPPALEDAFLRVLAGKR